VTHYATIRPALMPANERQALTQKLDHSDQAGHRNGVFLIAAQQIIVMQ